MKGCHKTFPQKKRPGGRRMPGRASFEPQGRQLWASCVQSADSESKSSLQLLAERTMKVDN